ncbi:MAG: hypothetical protein ISS41_09085 [Candidatus Aminicenantes bacterium]|nr:hypothetical protein [Candidatus Aminicenantes bacterium]
MASIENMKNLLSRTDIIELKNNTKLDEDELNNIVEYLEKRELEITITTILETAVILWGLDFLLD